MDEAQDQPKNTFPASPDVKRPYARPQLTVYGTVAELTTFPGGSATDGQGGSTAG